MSKNPPAVEVGGASVLKEDSFVQRRTLFRAIWDSAGSDKEGSADEQTIKRKVIETLRLDELDKTAVRRKKQRIKNLRSVCKRILDFCDRQEKEEQDMLAIEENKLKDSDGISTKTKRSKNVKKKLTKDVYPITEDNIDMIEKTARKSQKSPQRLERLPEESTKSTSTVRKKIKLKKKFSYTGRRRVVAYNKKRLINDDSDLETIQYSGPLAAKPKSPPPPRKSV